jgi:hypothetical protein
LVDAEVLPLREADAAVVAQERRDGVRQVLREQVPVGVAAVDADRRELQRGARVLVLVGARAHRRVHLVRDERDEAAGDVDGVDVVVVARWSSGESRTCRPRPASAAPCRCGSGRSVRLHREDGLRRVERHVGAVEVGRRT